MCPSGTTVHPSDVQALNDTQRQSLLDWLRREGAMPTDQMGLDLDPALLLTSKVWPGASENHLGLNVLICTVEEKGS